MAETSSRFWRRFAWTSWRRNQEVKNY